MALPQVVEMMQRSLGTKVRLRGSEEKGTIEIEFYSRQDLERIMDVFGVHL